MDRISALRNVEDALSDFEAGETDLAGLERRVRGTLRTYATDLDGDLSAYRAVGEEPADGVVVLAPSAGAARERVAGLLAGDPAFEVEAVEP
ncbi:hypothetical protein [Halosegnis marinus]|uniref:Uncharacterized protein n=1 Tax=Halosegnis marinus TaxID=3034023 RepID=A0ABD5ZNY5_9EURY|nr:hypothetical protein [Halosegnis sp. DT85]